MKSRYLDLYRKGKLLKRVKAAEKLLIHCRICPHECGVDRTAGEFGICSSGSEAMISSYGPHFGEEQPLIGTGGSGTIFFSNCNLLCIFCQNYDISHCRDEQGQTVDPKELAVIMLELQKMGCHNINFVTPTHVVPQILEALIPAIEMGLNIPLVYNSNGYDKVETLELLDGVVDIYMPDFKFWDAQSAQKYTNAPDYPGRVQRALKEMHRQVGDLVLNADGIAQKGLLVRHLVMPEGVEESKKILAFIATKISKNTYINIMDQYRPCGEAMKFSEINRGLNTGEHKAVVDHAKKIGLDRLDKRDMSELLRKLGLLR